MPAKPNHRHALIIGVDRAADPHLAPLASAERDARALAAALEAPECGFTVTLLLAEQATAAAVRDHLIHFIHLAATPSADLIVIFCGHGVSLALSSGGNETFLATSDFRGDVARRDPTRFLSLGWLYEQVYAVDEPRSAIAVLDCCFAGDIAHAGKDALTIDLRAAIEQYRQQQRQLDPANRLRAIIAATGPHQKVAETATGGALAQALLAVLRGDKLLAEGEITIGHLDDYLKRHFAGQEQQPYTKIEGNYRLILADHRDRVAAQRAAAERQRHHTETQAMLARWRNHDSLGRAAELQRDFVGRAAELAAIQAHIEQLRPTGGYLLVTGVAGQGKSSVLASLRQTTDPPLPAYFIRFTPGPHEQAALLGHLIAELLEQHGLAEEALTYLASDASAITLRNSLTSLLDRLARRQPLTLIIDGLDQIPVQRDLGQRDLSFLPERLPAGVVIVIGTRPDDTLVPLTLQTQHREYKLPPLSLSDFARLLERRGVSLSEADRLTLHSALHGNAFDLTFLATELQREASARDVQALIQRVIANPRDIFRPTIERLKREPDWDNVIEPALGVLLSAQEPLSAPALAGILAQKYHRVQDAITRLR
ncbi:ATP-binding protein, partial [Chloroflexus sp.]|uniref:ATP-binding protein n=1 Tax=Chloroflexus sp. TaxID=1904827 RepID=UPI00298ED5BE